MTAFTARIPLVGARGLPGQQIVVATNAAPGSEVGNVGDIAIRYDDNGDTWLYGKKTEGGWPEPPRLLRGTAGVGWSPLIRPVPAGDLVAMQLVDWVGGSGDKPAGAGWYFGAAGVLVESIEDALLFGHGSSASAVLFDNTEAALPDDPETVQEAIDSVVDYLAGLGITSFGEDLISAEDADAARLALGVRSNAEKICFEATKNGTDQTGVGSATLTKITFAAETFDQGDYYDAANSRFTPPAGRYRIGACVTVSAGLVAGTRVSAIIYKNGSAFRQVYGQVAATSVNVSASVATVVEANGTDYFEIYVFVGGAGNKTVSGAADATYFYASEV